MAEKLKPCPFCGSVVVDTHDSKALIHALYVRCMRCNAMFKFFNEEKRAIKDWNTRAPLRKWEPGSEPPLGWYWVEYGGDEKCIAYYDGCTLEFIGGDSTEWTGETLYGPIPEPEVSE